MMGTMSYRPYPDADRAVRQVQRHQPTPAPTELQLRMARQAKAALAAVAEALRPLAASIPPRP